MVPVLTILLFLPALSLSAVIGDTCSSNSECQASIRSSMCEIVSPSCGAGVCTCIPGFIDAQNGTQCLAARRLGENCGEGDMCINDNTRCFKDKCVCSSGHAPNSGLCMGEVGRLKAGERCHDSVDCTGSLVCYHNKCGCYPDYTIVGCCDCARKMFGDSCTDQSDCLDAPNTICSDGLCACDSSSKMVSYTSTTSFSQHPVNKLTNQGCQIRSTCVSNGYRFANEGEECSEPLLTNPMQPFQLCKSPLVCVACSNTHRVCASRPSSCFRLFQSDTANLIKSHNILFYVLHAFAAILLV